MTKRSIVFFVSLMSSALVCAGEKPRQLFEKQVLPFLETQIANIEDIPRYSFSGEVIHTPRTTSFFYARRQYEPAWSQEWTLSNAAYELLRALERSDKEALDPAFYHTQTLRELMSRVSQTPKSNKKSNPLLFAQLDILLTDAFLTYGSHLLSGRINPTDVSDEWFAIRRSTDLMTLLESVLKNGEMHKTLKSLLPKQSYYAQLRIALDRYRTIEKNGGWDIISSTVVVKPGQEHDSISHIRKRLSVEGDFKGPLHSIQFDRGLEQAVKNFQSRLGLDTDGILGLETIKRMNIPIEHRINQIRLNMERCRWLPGDLGEQHILVNVANFALDVMEHDESLLSMKVVVGRRYRRTPVFSSTMTTVVFNPTWTVPKKIASLDILDHIREEPDYLSKGQFTVYDSYDDTATVVDHTKIDWAAVDPKNLPYRFKQSSGDLNALGKIKFLFSNPFDVYLHDTPSKELFKKTVRDFSSGCIRIEKPIELAEFLLHINGGWDKARIDRVLNTNSEQYVTLKKPIPVHLLYWTAWADKKGRVQFRDDIYDRDAPLERALSHPQGLP